MSDTLKNIKNIKDTVYDKVSDTDNQQKVKNVFYTLEAAYKVGTNLGHCSKSFSEANLDKKGTLDLIQKVITEIEAKYGLQGNVGHYLQSFTTDTINVVQNVSHEVTDNNYVEALMDFSHKAKSLVTEASALIEAIRDDAKNIEQCDYQESNTPKDCLQTFDADTYKAGLQLAEDIILISCDFIEESASSIT